VIYFVKACTALREHSTWEIRQHSIVSSLMPTCKALLEMTDFIHRSIQNFSLL
jgi:hypothetical protein